MRMQGEQRRRSNTKNRTTVKEVVYPYASRAFESMCTEVSREENKVYQ